MRAMEVVVGKIDINLVEDMPFVHKSDSTAEASWSGGLSLLKDQFPGKELCCARDSYITDACEKVRLEELFKPSESLNAGELYISHVFHHKGYPVDPELDNAITLPQCLASHAIKQFRIKRLVAGAAGTGTALHQHSRAYFHNIKGKKRWFLACPSAENGDILSKYTYDISNKRISSISDWFDKESTKLATELQGCSVIDLEPGESLYIPDGFFHAVLNLSFTVGVAFSWEEKFQNRPG